MANNSGGNFGGIIAIGLIGAVFILTAILFPLSNDWKWFLVLIGVCIVLLLVAGSLWNTAFIFSCIIFALALIVGVVAFYFFQKASRPTENTQLFQQYIQYTVVHFRALLA